MEPEDNFTFSSNPLSSIKLHGSLNWIRDPTFPEIWWTAPPSNSEINFKPTIAFTGVIEQVVDTMPKKVDQLLAELQPISWYKFWSKEEFYLFCNNLLALIHHVQLFFLVTSYMINLKWFFTILACLAFVHKSLFSSQFGGNRDLPILN